MTTVSIRFKEWVSNDNEHPQRLEDAIRKCAVFSGIHDHDFQDKILEPFDNLDDWTTDTTNGTTWTITSGQLVIVGGGSSLWYQGRHDTEIPPSFVASFDLVSGEGAFVFRCKSGTTDAYAAFWNATEVGFLSIADDRTETRLTVLPESLGVPSRIQVSISYRYDSVDDGRKWLLMALHADGRNLVSYAIDLGDVGDWTGDDVGFAIYDGDTMIVDNFTISEFARIADYVSIDPGEMVSQGLSRTVSTTRILYAARFDGTLRVTRPGDRDNDYVIPSTHVLRYMQRDEIRSVLTHVRTIGAIHFVDRFDDDEGEVHMHRFVQTDNPNLMTAAATYEEAGHQLHDAEERQGSYQIATPMKPWLERQDRVQLDGIDYRILSVNNSLQSGQAGLTYTTILEARKYIPE